MATLAGSVLSLLAFVCLFLTHRSGIIYIYVYMQIYFLFIFNCLKKMRAFKSADRATIMALHGENVVMILFIFFVFADPINDYAGTYQVEYAADRAAELTASNNRSTRTTESNGESENRTRIYQNDRSTRTTTPATTAAATTTTTNQRQWRTKNKFDHQLSSTEYDRERSL